MRIIESRNNTFIKDLRKLKEKKYRNESNKFLVEGWKLIEEALRGSWYIEYILFNETGNKEIDKIIDLLPQNTEAIKVSQDVIKSISCTENPQGIVGVISKRNMEAKIEDGFYILLDKVQDPGNIGTIIRTAHASGAKGVILTKGTADIYNEKVLRSTMGSIFHIPIIDSEKFITLLKEKGYTFIVSSLQSKENFFDVNLKGNTVICVGNEGNGVSKEIYDLADVKVKIPMPGDAESLNVSIASAIMMFEIVRQNLS